MKKIIYGLIAFGPVLALAQTNPNLGGITSLVQQIGTVIKTLIPIAFALAIVYFFYGLAKYILAGASDPKKHDEGRQIMIWGIIAIAVMASVYGLINWLQGTLGVSGTGTVNLPTVPGL